MIPYGRQTVTQDDIDAVIKVLKSDFLTQGPVVPRFEQAICKKVGSKYAVAVNSATSALHIACMAVGLEPGDRLWTTPITFVASANCALYCGAQVDFVDINPLTYNLCPNELEKKLIEAELEGTLPKVVIPVHLSGRPCEMKKIWELSKKYKFRIIEDASHAIGAKYEEESIGNSRFSDITVFSFHPVKIITTAEGGMALTNDSELAKSMELYRTHGITREEDQMSGESHGPWYYEQIKLGYNYRMTEIQAALGLSQLERLDNYVTVRNSLAKRYSEKLSELPLVLPEETSNSYSSMHLYIIRLQLHKISKSHQIVFQELRQKEIGVNLHYIPVHTQPYYQSLGFFHGQFPNAEAYYQNALSIPLYQTLTHSDQDKVIKALHTVLEY